MQRQHSVQATAVTSPIVLDGFAGEREKQLDLLRTTVLAFRRARNAGLALDPGALLQVMKSCSPGPWTSATPSTPAPKPSTIASINTVHPRPLAGRPP